MSSVLTYAVVGETPMSPGHTERSRFAPSASTSVPVPMTPLFSQPEDGGGQTRPWVGSIVSSCMV